MLLRGLIMDSTFTQGLTLMVAGMGTVIFFLTVMVSVMQLTGAYFKKNVDRFREQPKTDNRVKRVSNDDSEVIAVAIAAVRAYVKK
jgi:sodium pump decarboxylase gamma subunit